MDKTPLPVSSNSLAPQISSPAQRTVAQGAESEQPASRSQISSLPPANQPVVKIDLPPIGYDATSVTENAEPLSVATLMLAKEAKVEPEWIFHGTVAEPPRATKSAGIATAKNTSTEITPKQQPGKHASKKSFWTRLHDFFAGSPAKTDCVGEGCG
jgi:hypothetical protein